LTDAVDEYLTQNLTEYEDKKFQNAKFKEVKESYKELTKWWKDLLSGEMVEAVKVSSVLNLLFLAFKSVFIILNSGILISECTSFGICTLLAYTPTPF
jgi:UDP-N-acetylglucosamine 2-epimerase